MSTPLHLQSLPAAVVGFWWLYLLECKGGVFYAGITNDIARRYRAHASGNGARFTRARPPPPPEMPSRRRRRSCARPSGQPGVFDEPTSKRARPVPSSIPPNLTTGGSANSTGSHPCP
ncbi:GIY-YIG nuclease family protein [Xanthomonas citri]|uniref:GIY-YIG nuclease family protein n=1 Tax=Xanthomonas citri TaxID=346 RepID=UPI003CCFC0DF